MSAVLRAVQERLRGVQERKASDSLAASPSWRQKGRGGTPRGAWRLIERAWKASHQWGYHMPIISIRAEGGRPAPELTHPHFAPLCSELRAGRCAQATLLKTSAPSEDALAPRHPGSKASIVHSRRQGTKARWHAGGGGQGQLRDFDPSARSDRLRRL